MMVLALDIGKRKTGVAFGDSSIGVPLALETITHASTGALLRAVRSIVSEKHIDRIVAGLPLLPSGAEGDQARYVRTVASALEEIGVPVSVLDERYTTPPPGETDGDAAAAVELLRMALQRDL